MKSLEQLGDLELVTDQQKATDVGVSLNGGTPNLHPKMNIFSRKTNGCLVPPF